MKVNYESTQSLNKLLDTSRSIRSRFEPQWYLNLAFYLGDQWVYWNNGRIDKPIIPEHRLLLTTNRIMPVILTRLARKVKQRPDWTVVPNSNDDDDIDSAELGELIMEGKWKELHMYDHLYDALEWADVACAGFWKMSWDSTSGKQVDLLLGPDGSPLKDDNGRTMRANELPTAAVKSMGLKQKTISEGDVHIEVRNPFEMLPDPLGKTIDTCEWIGEEVVQSEEYVYQHHNIQLSGDTEIAAGPSDSRFFPSWRMGGSTDYKGVKVRELWVRPCKTTPKGKHVVWAKDKILLNEDNHYECLPYVMFEGVPVPGRFWPTSVVEQLREPQIELNKLKSQIRENAQRLGNPAFMSSRMANIKYTGVPGEWVKYDDNTPNAQPSYLVPPPMPQYVVDELERINTDIMEISGQHEVSGANVPAGVTAASAINLLLEQDDTRLGPVITQMETVLSEAGQMILKLIAEYYDEQRFVTLAGEDAAYSFVQFKGSQLRNNFNIEVQAGSTFPASKAAKQAAIEHVLTLMIQNGQSLDERNMRKMFKDYAVGGLEAFYSDITRDVTQTNREHRLMYQGTPLPINSTDNDEIHIEEHSDEMKSAKWFRSGMQTQAIFDSHIALHKQRLDQIQQDAQDAQLELMQKQTLAQEGLSAYFSQKQSAQDHGQQKQIEEMKMAAQTQARKQLAGGGNNNG